MPAFLRFSISLRVEFLILLISLRLSLMPPVPVVRRGMTSVRSSVSTAMVNLITRSGFFPEVALMVLRPKALAVMVPSGSTVATLRSEEVQIS